MIAKQPNLPDDPALLKSMILELLGTLDQEKRKNQDLLNRIEKLCRSLYGRKSEKWQNPGQLLMDFSPEVAAALGYAGQQATDEAAPREKKKRKGHGRRKLPAHLPRVIEEHVLQPEECVCATCGKELKRIGEEKSFQIDYEPASLFVREVVRAKYACRPCQGNVVIAQTPPQPIEKGMAGPGLLSHVITSKYADHIPLHRQEGIFSREGLDMNRSTLSDWVGRCADLLKPIYDAMREDVLASRIIQTDDTPVPVREKGRTDTKKGRLWVYVGDRDHENIVFDYTPDRKRDGPLNFMGGFEGYAQADAYAGYDALFAGGKVVEVGCWAHARRKYHDAQSTDAANAHAALAFIGRLYEVERTAKALGPWVRKEMRQKTSAPVLEEFKAWLGEASLSVLPRSPMGEAMRYTLAQWAALNRYLEDGDLPIDNNAAERALRGVAVGRKNWTFCGNDEGGRRAAIHYSLVTTCKHHGVDTYRYLRDCLEQVSVLPQSRISELFPKNWKAANQARAEKEAVAAAEEPNPTAK